MVTNVTGVEETCLTAHNKVRELHSNTGALEYDRDLARGAADWARQLAETDTFQHSNTGLGENLFFGSTTFKDFTFTPTQAVFQWSVIIIIIIISNQDR